VIYKRNEIDGAASEFEMSLRKSPCSNLRGAPLGSANTKGGSRASILFGKTND